MNASLPLNSSVKPEWRLRSLTAATLLAASLLLAPPQGRADDAGPSGKAEAKAWCDANPAECAARKAKSAEFCQENPQRCERMKQRAAERQAWCEKNPAECAAQREQMKAKREEMKAKCAADPAKCEEMKKQGKHGRKHNHQHGPDGNRAPEQPSS